MKLVDLVSFPAMIGTVELNCTTCSFLDLIETVFSILSSKGIDIGKIWPAPS